MMGYLHHRSDVELVAALADVSHIGKNLALLFELKIFTAGRGLPFIAWLFHDFYNIIISWFIRHGTSKKFESLPFWNSALRKYQYY